MGWKTTHITDSMRKRSSETITVLTCNFHILTLVYIVIISRLRRQSDRASKTF